MSNEKMVAKLETAIAENGMSAPSTRVEIEFCELYLGGRSAKDCGLLLGINDKSALMLEKKFKGWVLSKVLENKDKMKADLLLRVTRKILSKEDIQEDDKGYYDYLKLGHEMLKEDTRKSLTPPKNFLVFADEKDIKDAEIVENKNAVNSSQATQVATASTKQ